VISKLGNTRILSKNHLLSPHIPETHLLTKQNLQNMLRKYHTVYIKPNDSCQGKGVIRVDHIQKHFQLKTRDQKATYRLSNIDQVMARIQKVKMNRTYIVQRGIDSYTHAKKLFDIRVHLLRIHGKWEIGGIIGRIASNHGVATNAYSGGTPVQIQTLLQKHLILGEHRQKELMKELTTLSLETTRTFSKAFPKWAEFGLDIGMDKRGHLWIYEINITPGMLVFRKDRTSYQRIMKMKRQKS
jgi:hypothetical protein